MTSLWTDLDRTFSELDRLMRATTPTRRGPRAAPSRPTLRSHKGEEGWQLEVDLPGVPAGDVAVEVEDGALRLKASRTPTTPDATRALRRERLAWALDETLPLPAEVNADAITASMQDGRLRLHLPLRARTSRTIPVETL